jgi:hypothetical protein
MGQATLDNLDRFHYPGFSAYEGPRVADTDARERLASYIIRPAFSRARLHHHRDAGIARCLKD